MSTRILSYAFTLWFIAIFFLTENHAAENSKIDAYLETILNSADDHELIDVYIVMKDRLSLADLQNVTWGLKRKEKQRAVVQILKEHAAATQSQVMNHLEIAKAQNSVDQVVSIWAINVIAFKGTRSVIYDLAQGSSGIEKIYYDAPYPEELLIDDLGITAYNRKHGLYTHPNNPTPPQPGLLLINAPQVWAEGDSGQGVLVANIDTGTDWRHPDLANNIWNNLGEDADGDGRTMEYTGTTWVYDPGDINNVDDDANGYIDDFIGWNLTSNNNDPSSGSSHGTATSGIVAGDGTNGTQTGVAPRAKLIILKPSGESQYWSAQQYAMDKGADVVTSSLSYKWYFSPQPNYPMFRQMTDMELAAGMVHSNSTSNDGSNLGNAPIPYNIATPGNCPPSWLHPDQTLMGALSSVIGCGNVSATTDIIQSSSPHGPAAWEDIQANYPSYPYSMPLGYQDYPYETVPGSIGLLKPDVSSPGNGTTSTAPGGGYQSFSGTSGATPHVAGTVALMLAANPDLEPADVSRILQTTAVEKGTPGKDSRYGAGRIDAYQAYLQSFSEAGAPNSPTDFLAYSDFSTPTSMNLTWTDPTNLFNGDTLLASDFSILIKRDDVLIDSVSGGTSQYADTGLNDGQEYTYGIYSRVDSTGRESDIVSASWIAGGSPIPSPPEDFSIAGNQNQVTISWTSPTVNVDGTPMDDYAGVNLYQNGVFATAFSKSSADTGIADSDIYSPGTPGFYDWHITTIDSETPQNQSDPTSTLGTPLSTPIVDEFTTPGDPNPGIWINSNTDVNDRAVSPPSGQYALNLNGKPVGEDIVDLKPLDMTGMQGGGIMLSYYYQPQGTGNEPEEQDSLRVYFKNDLGDWVLVMAYPGSSVQPFQQEVIDIETAPNGGGSYFHGQFQVRFRSTGGAGAVLPNDDWFVDDVFLDVPVSVKVPSIFPTEYAVSPNYPNPFNPTTAIEYQIPEPGHVSLVIYNMLGQSVRTLLDQTIEAGFHKTVWDGTNDAGRSIASGIYIYRFQASSSEGKSGDFLRVKKMVMLK